MSWSDRQLLKSIGAFLTSEVKTFARWANEKPIYRKVVNTGTLPNATSANTAHGLTGHTLVKIYGVASDGTNQRPLPYASTTLNNVIQVTTNATNIIITTAIDYSSYTSSYVVLEYTL
jgi:hypothetical protein